MTRFRYYLGYSDERPMFRRFTYAEKMEYWALVWGMFVMAGTGLMAWFKVFVGERVPGWWIDVAITIHLYEAMLATLAIVVWHMYGSHLRSRCLSDELGVVRRQDVDRALRARASAGHLAIDEGERAPKRTANRRRRRGRAAGETVAKK